MGAGPDQSVPRRASQVPCGESGKGGLRWPDSYPSAGRSGENPALSRSGRRLPCATRTRWAPRDAHPPPRRLERHGRPEPQRDPEDRTAPPHRHAAQAQRDARRTGTRRPTGRRERRQPLLAGGRQGEQGQFRADSASERSGIQEVSVTTGADFARLPWTPTDSVCFADNPELHRIASSTSGTRPAPTRSARIERVLQPIQSESVSDPPGVWLWRQFPCSGIRVCIFIPQRRCSVMAAPRASGVTTVTRSHGTR